MTTKKNKNKQQAKIANVSWTPCASEEYLSWQKENQKIVNEINNLIGECQRNPFKGTGKPEPLSGDLTGYWSRRITHKHRLVYLPEDGTIYIVSCCYHY